MSKECWHCKSQIPEGAGVCPHCRGQQFYGTSYDKPVVSTVPSDDGTLSGLWVLACVTIAVMLFCDLRYGTGSLEWLWNVTSTVFGWIWAVVTFFWNCLAWICTSLGL